MKRAVTLHVLLPLFVGGVLYLGARSTSLWMFHGVVALHVEALVDVVRVALAPVRALPEWVRFSVPDGLWAYALAWTLVRTWRRSGRTAIAAAIALSLACGPGFELAQRLGWIPGTFDAVDVLLTTLGVVLASVAALAQYGDAQASRAGRSVSQGGGV